MTNYLYTIVYSLVLVFSAIYIWHKLLDKKINFKDYRFYVSLVSLMVISVFNFFLINNFIKIIIITITFMIFFRFLFKEELTKCIITPIYYQILIMLSEAICLLIIVTIFRLNVEELKEGFSGTFIINIAISIISILISKISFVRKVYRSILNTVDKIGKKYLIVLSLLIICVANIMAAITYYQLDIRLLIIINVIFTLFCFLIVLYSFRIQNDFNKVSDKYNVAINSLTDYEDMMSKYRVENHENQNLLLTIRAMVVNKEKDIPKYIDSIVKDKYEDNEKLLLNMSVIPSGGLRATIYSEILKIKDNKIDYNLVIDKKLKTIDLIEMETDIVIDACKIICVFIDNAIEEVKNLVEKFIEISLYLEDNKINIKVSNNYKSKMNVEKIFDEGYTTKGKGHGYGLALVKKIISNNKVFSNKTEISRNIFSQYLSINIKKHIK